MTAVSVKLVPPIHTEHMERRAVMPRKPNVTTVEKNPGSRLGYVCGTKLVISCTGLLRRRELVAPIFRSHLIIICGYSDP